MTENKETYFVPAPSSTRGNDMANSDRGTTLGPAERMKRHYYDGLEVEAFRRGAGMTGDKSDQHNNDNRMPPDIANIVLGTVNAQSQALTGLLTKIVEIQKPADGEQNQFMQYLVNEVKDMKGKMEGSAGPDPLEVIEETSKRIDSLTETMRKRMGIPEMAASGGNGIEGMKMMLEIENMKQQAQERQNQFDLGLKTMERRWQQEDRHWELEFKLKVDDARKSNESKEKSLNALQDLAASIIESIEIGPGPSATSEGVAGNTPQQEIGAAPSAAPEPEPEPQEQAHYNIPSSFICSECGEIVNVAPDRIEARCESCGAEYDLREEQEERTE